jgi:nickel-dependent lactate racemase
VIGAERLAELTGGLMTDTSVEVRINRVVAEADVAIVVGPVFPHEVVGFSGGNKYFFPGVSGAELINLSHWVGALITSAEMIGTRGVTPVRALVNEAASLIPAERLALCLVVASGTDTLHTAAFGTPEDAWAACAEISAQTHVTYRERPVRRVLSIMPTKYEDIWTAAKGFYKLEPIVADGGEVIIYAPHITQISVMHPQIAEIGYHNRDYFLGQWDQFKDEPWGDLAHSTHLRGQGTWSAEDGERNRVTVTLATGIPEEVVRSVNLNYLDPADVDISAYEADPDTFVEPHAGEVLYRLGTPQASGAGEADGRGIDLAGLEG